MPPGTGVPVLYPKYGIRPSTSKLINTESPSELMISVHISCQVLPLKKSL